MTPTPTEEEVREIVFNVLSENPHGTRERGCHSHLEVCAYHLQTILFEPLLKARADAGMIEPLDDKGHDTEFTKVWNRALKGESKSWDCRELATLFLQEAIASTFPDDLNWFGAENAVLFDHALLTKLPGYLTGAGMPAATLVGLGANGMQSWVEGTQINARMDGYQLVLENMPNGHLKPAMDYRAHYFKDEDIGDEDRSTEMFGLMNFQGDGIEHDEGVKAWQAWRDEADQKGIMHRFFWDSVAGMVTRSLKSKKDMGITWQQLRQDESVSVEAGPEGLVVYGGQVNGLKKLFDEGQFLCGPRDRFVDMLVNGGFSKGDAEHYLDRLVQGCSAFSATVPAGSKLRYNWDPETLYAFDMPDDEMIFDIEKSDALPILAVGTFEMPEMTTHRQRKAAALQRDSENNGMKP
ncbi:hypothetical protein [Salipiger sp. PrR003]|uniref:hypothetical protein n=1 Tax=Salipiger sp. PrR003 TaxID=2706776 RepID=UPI0013DD07D5|nr:hypothetical protein [Salipiger sp. PrR003]NDV50185.1 hypothetical protein [Salipiger sp. PrR003]